MKPLHLTIIFISFLTSAKGQDTVFTAKDFDSAKVYYKVSKIPDIVKNKVIEIEGEWAKIADTGGKWEASDAVRDMSLPRRVLICFIKMPTRYILCYEQGGYSIYTCCYVFQVRNNKLDAAVMDRANGIESYKTLKEYLLGNKAKFKAGMSKF